MRLTAVPLLSRASPSPRIGHASRAALGRRGSPGRTEEGINESGQRAFGGSSKLTGTGCRPVTKRDRRGVTANDILRAAGTVEVPGEEPSSELMSKVVIPVLSIAEQEFGQALSRINLEDMARHAERLNGGGSTDSAA